jgi:hypothetical protein
MGSTLPSPAADTELGNLFGFAKTARRLVDQIEAASAREVGKPLGKAAAFAEFCGDVVDFDRLPCDVSFAIGTKMLAVRAAYLALPKTDADDLSEIHFLPIHLARWAARDLEDAAGLFEIAADS